MDYILGQYYGEEKKGDTTNTYMKLLSGYTMGVMLDSFNFSENDTGSIHIPNIIIQGEFEIDKVYYFHGKIKISNKENQIINHTLNIKLCNTEKSGQATYYTRQADFQQQYIKQMILSTLSKDDDGVDIDFIFSPMLNNFNTILFDVTRTIDDILDGDITIEIQGFEISAVNNAISTISTTTNNISTFVKMGVQSRPGFRMCINQEEIFVGKSGIYEIKNGQIQVNFFSLIEPIVNYIDINTISTKTNENGGYNEINLSLPLDNSTSPPTLFGERNFSYFTLDYIGIKIQTINEEEEKEGN